MHKIVCLAIHGMGSYFDRAFDDVFDTEDFDFDMFQAAKLWVRGQDITRLPVDVDAPTGALSGKVIWQPVLWSQKTLEQRQAVLRDGRPRLWRKGFEFTLSALSDVSSYQLPKESKKFNKSNNYFFVQNKIHAYLHRIERALLKQGENPESIQIVIFAHSMGCHVISSYAWDAQNHPKRIRKTGMLSKFCQLDTLASVIFTGCNIPVITMGVDPTLKVPMRLPIHDGVKQYWDCFYDRDDVLGYPLEPEYQSYRQGQHPDQTDLGVLQTPRMPDQEIGPDDHRIDVGQGFRLRPSEILDRFGAMTPLAHLLYWKDQRVINAVGRIFQGLGV